MVFTFKCPECGRAIQANEDLAGLQGRCPNCSATFPIPESGRPARPVAVAEAYREDEVRGRRRRQSAWDDEDAPRRARSESPRYELAPGWGAVRSGLLLVRLGLIISIFVALGVILVVVLSNGIGPGLGRGRGTETLLAFLAMLVVLLILAAGVLVMIGQSMCCAAPSESGAKGLAIGSVICLILFLFLMLVLVVAALALGNRVNQFQRNYLPLVLGLGGMASIVLIVAHILFALFLRATAGYFGNESLARSARTFLIVYLIFLGIQLVLPVLSALLAPAGPGLAGRAGMQVLFIVLGIAMLVFALALFLWFLDLVGRTRATIGKALAVDW